MPIVLKFGSLNLLEPSEGLSRTVMGLLYLLRKCAVKVLPCFVTKKDTGYSAVKVIVLTLSDTRSVFFRRLSHKRNINLLKPTGRVTHHQFNIQQLYALPTLYLCAWYLSENKQRLVPLTA